MSGKIINTDTGEEYDSVDALFKKMDAEWKKEHPIAYWVDHNLFKEKTLLGYAPHYSLTHPHKVLADWGREIKWAWQRVFRGWDDRAIWAIDLHIAKVVPEMLDKLNSQKIIGISIEYFDKDTRFDADEDGESFKVAEARFRRTLKDIANGFRAYGEVMEEGYMPPSPEYKERMDKYEHAMKLFVKHFHTLGD